MKIGSITTYNINNTRINNCITFCKNKEIIDEGDYVRISKKKYNRDRFWKGVDIVILLSAITYWLFDAINYKAPKI